MTAMGRDAPVSNVDVTEAMKRFGGGFVQALGAAAAQADPENLRRIKTAFPEYWSRYTKLARERRPPS